MEKKRMQRLLKRALDLAASSIGLIVLAIPFALIALAIKLDSKGRFSRQGRGAEGLDHGKCKQAAI